jgi:peptidylprolyl isomerase
MKLGEERQVVIPGHEGYGPAGFPAWGIPPNGTLDFTLEVLKIA